MSDCAKLQDRVLEDGAQASTAVPELREHLSQCRNCQAFLGDLQKLTGALQALPSVDAPDALVDDTVRRVLESPIERPRPERPGWLRRHWLSAVASVFLIVIVSAVMMPAYQTYTPRSREAERFLSEYERTRKLAEELQRSEGLLADLGESQSELESLGEAKLTARMQSGVDLAADRDLASSGKKFGRKQGLPAGNEQLLDELAASGLAG
ncbi:MAG: hypothetical protein OET44_19700, partial [Gammaproteobacteria bacterium]|nr:hypothetical protein [Gammaproteobacteria bacterium]